MITNLFNDSYILRSPLKALFFINTYVKNVNIWYSITDYKWPVNSRRLLYYIPYNSNCEIIVKSLNVKTRYLKRPSIHHRSTKSPKSLFETCLRPFWHLFDNAENCLKLLSNRGSLNCVSNVKNVSNWDQIETFCPRHVWDKIEIFLSNLRPRLDKFETQ